MQENSKTQIVRQNAKTQIVTNLKTLIVTQLEASNLTTQFLTEI